MGMSASDGTVKRIDISKVLSILLAILMISAGFTTLLSIGVNTGTEVSYTSEHFLGYDLESGTWVNADLGKAYMEGDFVSYQLRLDSDSKIWGAEEFSIKYNFYQAANDAIFVDGFDTSLATGFQYSTGDILMDGVQVPSAGWGTHIATPEAGESAGVTDPQIINYMDVWEVGDPDSEADPNDMRYFTVKNLPWEDFTDGYVILFFRAHLALSILWRADLEQALPQVLDGDEFEDWTGISPHNGSSYTSGSSRHFTLEYPGIGARTIPIPITSYPTDIITGRKFINEVPYDGWEMNMIGRLSLWGTTGADYVYIPYNPPTVLTGTGPWALGYFAFDGLPRGNYTVWESVVDGYILDVIGTSPDLHLYDPGKLPYFDAVTETWLDNPDEDLMVHFDLERGTKISPKVQNIDFYNLQVGDISGYKIHDTDGDGVPDEGEPGLAGWTIELWEEDGLSAMDTTTTDNDGYFEFTDILVGQYIVKEVMQDGWFNTTPVEISVCVSCGSDIDSLLFLNTMYSSICGYKVEDMNGNGVRDDSDPVIYDWEIQLYKDDVLVDTAWTDESGKFCFDQLVPGHYKVMEVMPIGWYFTDEQYFIFDIVSGDREEAVFLNTEKVSICGYKYEDMNGNGILEEGDAGIAGWVIYLFKGSVEEDERPIATATTNGSGGYCFTGLEVGTYTVVEESREGWYNTTLSEVEVTLSSGGSANINFLNTEYFDLCGYKYEDMNGTSILDDGDEPVEGWLIQLVQDDEVIRSALTDENGRFCFTDLKPGEYTIREGSKEGWYATSPTEATLTMQSGGDERQTIFLNTQYGKICVLKYEDLNANGQWDEGEPGMASVFVELYEANGEAGLSAMPTPIRSGLTDENGTICFTGLFLGDYILVEYPPLGTYPNSQGSSLPVSITESNQTVQVTFGNIETGHICVFKYEDLNGNGVRDEGEDTLVSVFVELLFDGEVIKSGYTGTCPCCEGLCFSGLELGTYTVRETVPEGWYNTTAAEVVVVLDQSGEYVPVTFLNTEYSSIAGNKYQDMDGDGYLDAEDTPIEGWEIELWLDDEYIATNFTDENGYFQFDKLVPGNYYVIEMMQEDWYATTTTEVYVRLHSGDIIHDVLFLNTQNSSVCGYKVEDMDGNGIWDEDEEGILGWEVRLYRMMDQVLVGAPMAVDYELVATEYTDEDGEYCFTGLTPGQYKVEEVMQAGWYNTSPLGYTFEITSGDKESFDFLNTQMGRICGYKVEDLDGDGEWDDNEIGVEGWYIELWKDGSYLNHTCTGSDGRFCFDRLYTGEYTVYEGYNASWYSTGVAHVNVSISSGTVKDDAVFLNTRYGQICVQKFEDENGNGIRDEGEDTPVNGVLIEVLLDHVVVRSGYTGSCQCQCGMICFTSLELGNYIVRETLNEGWYTEGPLEQNANIDVSGECIEITFMNIRLGQICVLKYHDLDGDGIRDDEEPVKADVTIELQYPNGTVIESAVTDESGQVCFTGLILGDYIVKEIVPEGWYATNGTQFAVGVEESGQYIEVEFLNTEYGRICVYKYEDLNGDGEWQENEPAVSGVTITLKLGDVVVENGTTDENGTICFTGLELGEYTVVETVPTGWYNTIPVSVDVTLDESGECVPVTFLNTKYGQICVFKYEDLNGDGEWQENEPAASGVFVTLFHDGEEIANGTTDCDGIICFTGLELGEYTVVETVPTGWYNTIPVSVDVTLDLSGECQSATFLNARYGSICVYKYEDEDGDGILEEGEDDLIDGVTIELYDVTGALVGTGVTGDDGDGKVCFTHLRIGTYYAEETVPAGWYATSPIMKMVTVGSSGDENCTYFLNTMYGSICVFKYEDLNGNGRYETGEPAVENVTVSLWRDDEFVSSGVTDEDGRICFTGLRLGDYVVVETVPQGWYNTTAASVEVTIEHSGASESVTFLNTRFGQICVFKYEDLNGNGVNDHEPAVEGVFIELILDGGVIASGFTDCTGKICFTGLKLGDYTVNETVQKGWYATSPTSVDASLAVSGDRKSVEFLNARYGGICVYKYEDLDGNGILDEEDELYDGVTIVLKNATGDIVATGITGDDGDGKVCFTDLVIGVYTIEEIVPQGWYATSGTTRSVGLETSGDQNCTYFLNTMYGRICVFKFEDLDGDGEWDENEPAVSNVTIELRDMAGGLIKTNVTDENGIACFCGLEMGSYAVGELVPVGWYAYETNQIVILDRSGETIRVEFANLKYSKICVLKMEDENGNGVRDEGEDVPISGVFIELLLDDDVIDSGYTDCYGLICFTDLRIGEYTVRETVPEGWYNTTPTEVVRVIEGSGQSECVAFLNTAYGDICVQKYEDANGNGEVDEGDKPASGVTINLLKNDVIIATNMTDVDGNACFHMLRLGAYQVQEVLLSGWYTDGLLIQDAVIEGSGDRVSVTFLNILYGEICVWKYEDVNGNGEVDEGDTIVPGVLITLYDAQMSAIANGTTGDDGRICFCGLELGTYYVMETLSDEWYAQGPTLKQVVIGESGESVSESFLNIRYGKICVFKFEDLNGDGVWQEGEPGLEGIVIELVQDCVVIRSGETNESGWICFDLLRFGTYWARENLAASDMDCCWYPSTPDRVQVTLSGEDRCELVVFGNVMYGKICGWKYFDANENGQFDPCTESGIAGWEIELWLDGKLFAMTHTDSHGHFCFAGLEFGDYTVTEVMQDGWYATGPTSWNVTIDVSGDREDVFFLNAMCGKICVLKYEDLDGDGILDDDEPAVPGITVLLYRDDVKVGEGVTDGNGSYCFEDLMVGTYAVVEEIPCNWYSTTGVVQQVVMTGQDATVTFLNTKYGCIGGFKYNDLDGDGVWDPTTEAGIPEWEIWLYQNGKPVSWTVTDLSGHYAFCGLRLGEYEVREGRQEGWMATSATELPVTIETSGQLVCGVNFFNMELDPCIEIEKGVCSDTIEYESHTQGYWKNHECSWVGMGPNGAFPWVCSCAYPDGLTNLQVFNTPPAGDATLILAHQYLAAKLNDLKYGAPAMYVQLISDAEGFLAIHPIGCSLSDDEREQATELADLLATYNEGEDSGMTVLTYTVVVTNCGNVELYNVKVYDSLLDQWFFLCDFGDGDGILDVGEWWTFSYTYIVPADQCGEEETSDDDDGCHDGGCGGWTWNWDHGCGGGCHDGDENDDGWSWSWGCGNHEGRTDGGCGGWNWRHGYGSGCGGWHWNWNWQQHCGCCCDDEVPTETCIVTNIATAYGQWGPEAEGWWVSDQAQADFELQQEEPIDDDDGCHDWGCGGWQWQWGWNWGCCWDHDWGCGNDRDCDQGWNWGGCSNYRYLNFGCFRWSGTFNDGMIGGCHVWNDYGPFEDERRGKEETEVSETEEK